MSTARQISHTTNVIANQRSLPFDSSGADRTSSRATSTNPSSLTELVLTQHSPDANLLLLPMLAHLSKDCNRWITWISDTRIDRQLLEQFGVDTKKIRLIHSDCTESTRWILWEALNGGTSHTVIATPGIISESELAHLETAAQAGKSRGLLIHYR